MRHLVNIALAFFLIGSITVGSVSTSKPIGVSHPTASNRPVRLIIANPDIGKMCHHVEVHLNGHRPVTLACLDPNPRNHYCVETRHWVHVIANLNGNLVNGNSLCIYGSTGNRSFVDLSDIPYFSTTFPGLTWDDKAAYWLIAHAPCTGRFYSGADEQGAYQQFSSDLARSSTKTTHGNFATRGHAPMLNGVVGVGPNLPHALPVYSLSSIGEIATGDCGG